MSVDSVSVFVCFLFFAASCRREWRSCFVVLLPIFLKDGAGRFIYTTLLQVKGVEGGMIVVFGRRALAVELSH
ncbi:MAG: hypothetical protein JOS17DRAFT_754731 [Linnemannia elongata]|nr:MAG: hypothetical protein JOS17DRAFT_754731 [Linnemannia elongata]